MPGATLSSDEQPKRNQQNRLTATQQPTKIMYRWSFLNDMPSLSVAGLASEAMYVYESAPPYRTKGRMRNRSRNSKRDVQKTKRNRNFNHVRKVSQAIAARTSHLVHTDFISSVVAIRVAVAHVTAQAHARLAHGRRAHRTGRHTAWAAWNVSGSRRAILAVSHLCHAPYPSRAEAWVLVAVAPAVDCSLDQAPLTAQRRVQLSQRPTHSIALRLVLQTIAAVLFLRAACPRIHAVLCLKLWLELIRIHRLNVTANGILHLDPIPRVLERNPLNTISILSDHEGSGRRDGSRRRVGVYTRGRTGRCVKLSPVLRTGRRTANWA